MTREAFDRELQRLQDEVLLLGSMVEKAISESVDNLRARDHAKSRELIGADRAINKKRYQIESDALLLIATQQPMATDLRIIASVLAISDELERMGDYAKGIAKISMMMDEVSLPQTLVDIRAMADKVTDMIHRALAAYASRDVGQAQSIPGEDDEVDNLYNQVYRELIELMTEDPSHFDEATHLMWAAHNLERAADRVTNICERAVFTVTGKMAEMDVDEGFGEGGGAEGIN
jgi:phosphate transport system protein